MEEAWARDGEVKVLAVIILGNVKVGDPIVRPKLPLRVISSTWAGGITRSCRRY